MRLPLVLSRRGLSFLLSVSSAVADSAVAGSSVAVASSFIGLAVGYPYVWLTLFLAFVIGGLIAGVLVVTKVVGRKDPIVFAPFLAAGAIVTLLFGEQIMLWWSVGL